MRLIFSTVKGMKILAKTCLGKNLIATAVFINYTRNSLKQTKKQNCYQPYVKMNSSNNKQIDDLITHLIFCNPNVKSIFCFIY